MSQSLIEKMRRARESTVEVGGFTFTYRRPTHKEFIEFSRMPPIEAVGKYVVNWSGVKEIDLISGGNPEPVPFSGEVWVEWVADRPDFWAPIMKAISASYKDYCAARDLTAKN